jgi:peptidoglycan hydrolase-like protein with peptidoglycan-binding domain
MKPPGAASSAASNEAQVRRMPYGVGNGPRGADGACPRVTIRNSRIVSALPLPSQEVTVNITLPELKAGDQDKPQDRMVHRLQGLLTALGSPVTIDGIFGPNTEAAVKDQQRAFKLAQTGVVDNNTWTVLIQG